MGCFSQLRLNRARSRELVVKAVNNVFGFKVRVIGTSIAVGSRIFSIVGG